MGRRTTRASLALLLAIALSPPGAAAQPVAGYDHGWQVEGLASGETGISRKTIVDSAMSLALRRGRYTGALRYADVVGVQAADSFSQASRIALELTGEPVSGGELALGSFLGTATLEFREAPSADAGAARSILDAPADQTVVYLVSGRWAAEVMGGEARGQVLYETAEVLSSEPRDALVRDAAWFNRLSSEFADQLGAPQEFAVRLGSGGGAGGGFWDAVGRGIRGEKPERPVLVPGDMARDAAALRDPRPSGATALPSGSVAIDADVPGVLLDAKNRAAGLLGEEGPAGDHVAGLRAAWRAAYAAVPGRPAPDDPVAEARARIEAAVAGGRAQGGSELLDAVSVAAGAGRASAAGLRVRAAVAEAVAAERPYASVLAGTAAAAEAVRGAAIPRSGPLADAVLVAAGSSEAPESARVVTAFDRAEALDARADLTGESLPARVLAAHGTGEEGGRGLDSPDGGRLAPAAWVAYRRAEGAVFWLAGADAAWALTDGSLRGWGYSASRAFLVNAADAGVVATVYPTP